jgi:hypothetical protein
MSTLGAGFAQVLQNLKNLANNQVALAQLKDLLAANIEKEQQLMSQITDWAATEQADLTTISTTLDGVVAGITALDALITAFQNSPGTLAVPDQNALDNIQAASKSLVAKVQAISVTPPTAVPPSV